MKHRNAPWLLLAGLTLGAAAHAGDNTPAETTYATYSGVTVAIDAATGKLRAPTAAEREQLAQKMLPSKQDRALAGRYANQPRTMAEARGTLRKSSVSGMSVRLPEDQMTQMNAAVDGAGHVTLSEGAQPAAPRKEELN